MYVVEGAVGVVVAQFVVAHEFFESFGGVTVAFPRDAVHGAEPEFTPIGGVEGQDVAAVEAGVVGDDEVGAVGELVDFAVVEVLPAHVVVGDAVFFGGPGRDGDGGLAKATVGVFLVDEAAGEMVEADEDGSEFDELVGLVEASRFGIYDEGMFDEASVAGLVGWGLGKLVGAG